jgi:hypothetical protein
VLVTAKSSRVISELAECGNSLLLTLIYYNGLSWSRLRGSFGLSYDGVAVVRDWV